MKNLLLFAALIMLLFTRGAGAQPSPASNSLKAVLSADRSTITVGDLITLTLEVKTPQRWVVEEPDMESCLKDLELRHTKKPLVQQKEGEKSTIYQYEITAFTTGKKTIGPLELQYKKNPDDREWSREKTSSLAISVESVLPKDLKNAQMKDIKPPVDVNYPWYYYAIGVGIVLILVLVTWLVVRHIRRKRAQKDAAALEALRSPEEIADERLRALKDSDYIESGKVKEYYIELSDIVREYLGHRYEPHAMDMTTYELYQALKESKITSQAAGDIKSLLSHCDLVKFAKFMPEARRMESDHEDTGKIINAIKPREAPEEPVAP